MRWYFLYCVLAALTVGMAFYETASAPHEHLRLYGFLAIFICQPWLLVGWILEARGVVRLGEATPQLVAGFAALNVVLGGAIVFLTRKNR
jgi:hypothetical protein